MKAAELRSKTIIELKNALSDLRKESFNLRVQKASGQMEGLSRKRIILKDIARIKTVITEKISKNTERE